MTTTVKFKIYGVFRFLPGETRSSNIFGAYEKMSTAIKKAMECNKRFADDEFEYVAEELPVLGEDEPA